jgi:hypothetical protein
MSVFASTAGLAFAGLNLQYGDFSALSSHGNCPSADDATSQIYPENKLKRRDETIAPEATLY